MEATVKCYKQQRTESERLDVYYSGAQAWLKGTQLAKWGRIPGMTARPQDPQGCKNG